MVFARGLPLAFLFERENPPHGVHGYMLQMMHRSETVKQLLPAFGLEVRSQLRGHTEGFCRCTTIEVSHLCFLFEVVVKHIQLSHFWGADGVNDRAKRQLPTVRAKVRMIRQIVAQTYFHVATMEGANS